MLRPPVCLLCRLVASVAYEGRGNTHTNTQDNYSNPRACAPRVKYSVVCSIRTPQSQSMTLHNKTPPLWTRTPHTLSRTPLPHNRTALIRTPLPHNRTALIRTLLPHNRTALIRTLLPHNRMCWTLVRSDLLLVLEDREDYLYRYTL